MIAVCELWKWPGCRVRELNQQINSKKIDDFIWQPYFTYLTLTHSDPTQQWICRWSCFSRHYLKMDGYKVDTSAFLLRFVSEEQDWSLYSLQSLIRQVLVLSHSTPTRLTLKVLSSPLSVSSYYIPFRMNLTYFGRLTYPWHEFGASNLPIYIHNIVYLFYIILIYPWCSPIFFFLTSSKIFLVMLSRTLWVSTYLWKYLGQFVVHNNTAHAKVSAFKLYVLIP